MAHEQFTAERAASASNTEKSTGTEQPEKLRTPQEEIAYLRRKIAQKEQELENDESNFERTRLAKREVARYGESAPAEVLHETVVLPEHDIVHKALELEPEEHDRQIDELLHIVSERGIRNALSVVARMKSPHLEDDLHRALVRYIAEGLPVGPSWVEPSRETWQALHMTLYRIEPAGTSDDSENQKGLEHLLASMEQLYAGLAAIASGGKKTKENVFSVEIAVAQGTEDVALYIAVPRSKRDMFERHALSIFPDARITEERGDYNIFNYEGEHAASYAELSEHPILPIRTYGDFEHDPMNVILSAFSKLKKHGEGAALQMIIGNEGERYNKYYRKVLRQLNKGESLKQALKTPETALGDFTAEVGKALGDAMRSKEKEHSEPKSPEQAMVERVSKKVETRIVPTTLRIVTSAQEKSRADEMLDNLASTCNQFADAQGNTITFAPLKRARLRQCVKEFTFRTPNKNYLLPLNLSELTSIFHLSAAAVSTSRELRKSRAKEAPAPVEMPEEGILLGTNTYGGSETEVRFSPEDRLRHFYVIGQTGTGKSNFLKYMMVQDILAGEGVCYIDPHGSDVIDVLASVPEERKEDVIYFDPAYTAMPMGLNMLEYDPTRPEQKTFVVDELLGIFRKLYKDVPESIGPAFEQFFRNATLLVMEDPATGNSMVDITRVFTDERFRKLKLSRCNNPLVVKFFEEIALKTQGEHAFENFAQYVTNKFDVFLANEIMRPIIAQEQSAFNFRDIMDNRKILLVNLSKGMLGDLNAHLIGLIFVGKIMQASLARADSVGKDLPPYYLYLDEFQNITTPSIETIFSEARKYKLSLTVAHQYIDQLEENIRESVFGNVGSKAAFRVGIEDGEFLERSFSPTFKATDIAGLNNFNAYLSLLVNGRPSQAFSMKTLPLEGVDYTRVDEYKQYAYNRYGRPRETVEAEIRAKYSGQSHGEQSARGTSAPTPGEPYL